MPAEVQSFPVLTKDGGECGQYVRHEAVNASSHGCQQHRYICAIVASGLDAFNGINLPTNPLNPRDKLLFFIVDVGYFSSHIP